MEELLAMDYFGEFLPLDLLARKYHLSSLIEQAQILRVAQAENKGYDKFVKRLQKDIREIERQFEADAPKPDYAKNFEMLNSMANRKWDLEKVKNG